MKFLNLLMAALFLTGLPVLKSAFAQCGASFTSCYICHDANGEMPVMYKKGVHGDHSFGYLCDFCHGGKIISMIKEEAHENMVADPLKYQTVACKPCHADYKDRAKKYEPAINENCEEK